MNKALFVILFAVALDAIGIGLIFPILPELLRELTAASDIDILYGVLISIYALMQFVFSPILGALSDRFGRRKVMMVSLAGAAIDYAIMALTPYMWLLIVTRLIAGLTSANMAVATAYITDISSEEERAGRFGLLHAMFGIGFIVGPVLGGLLGELWIRAPFVAAAVLNLLNFLLVLFIVPESRPVQDAKATWSDLNPLGPIGWALGVRTLFPYLVIFGGLSWIGQIYGSVWVLFGTEQLDWSPSSVGLSLAAFGAFHAAVQALLPGPVSRRFGERNAAIIGFVAESIALLAMGLFINGWVVIAVLPIFALGGVGMPALQSLATQQVDRHHQGRLQGVLMSLGSLMAIFGPLFFTGLYAWSKGTWAGTIWIVAAVTYFAVIAYMLTLKMESKPKGQIEAGRDA